METLIEYLEKFSKSAETLGRIAKYISTELSSLIPSVVIPSELVDPVSKPVTENE